MRSLFLAALAGATVLASFGAPLPAAAEDYPYCLQGRRWGYPGSCEFRSYEACRVAAAGTGDYCGINPRVAFERRRSRR